MANGRGGVRIGAGRKKKEQIVGKPKRQNNPDTGYEITELTGVKMPEPNEYLSRPTHGIGAQKRGVQIYTDAWNWLKARECEKLINPENLQLWALQVAKHEQLMAAIDQFGHLAKHPTTGQACKSPFEETAERYLKRATALWAGIEALIAERVKFYADKTGASKSPLDVLLNRSATMALNNGGEGYDE
jgi:hypothetical protein